MYLQAPSSRCRHRNSQPFGSQPTVAYTLRETLPFNERKLLICKASSARHPKGVIKRFTRVSRQGTVLEPIGGDDTSKESDPN